MTAPSKFRGLPYGPIDIAAIQRRFAVHPVTSCWLQPGASLSYRPRIRIYGRSVLVSVLFYESTHGEEFGQDMWALHSCDVMGCVNPWHVSPGTHAENVADAVDRGRIHKGDVWRAHSGIGATVEPREITSADEAEIRRAYWAGEATLAELGKRFGILMSDAMHYAGESYSNHARRLLAKRTAAALSRVPG